MGVATVFMCDECGKSEASKWSGEPKGWVRMEADAYWDGTNYHVLKSEKSWSFCSIKCFVAHMRKTSSRQGG